MASIPNAVPPMRPRSPIGEVWRRNPPLAALVLGMAAVLVAALLGLAVDPRAISGAPAWMKPLKFAVSTAIYGATVLWMLTFVRDRPRLVALVSWGVFLGFSIEVGLIVLQVVRGTTSHFNRGTPLDAAVWYTMAGVIVAMWLLNAVVAILLLRRRFAPPPVLWGVRFGVIAALIGMAVAFFMTRPTADQLALMRATGVAPIVGAHAVGVEDGGPGLPIVGWSTTGGDLRVAHFFGLHGLQVLPIVGLVLERMALGWLSLRDRARLVVVAACAWIGVTLLLTWQALRGQPLIAPDRLTLAAFAGLVAVAAIGSAVVAGRAWLTARSSKGRPRRGSWPSARPACQGHSHPG